jgi:ribosome-associated toxin RatA of RatAB toxin-antitoxin module
LPGVEVYKLPAARVSRFVGEAQPLCENPPTGGCVALPVEEFRLPIVERSALVTFTPAQMYALVNDVARYPEFLPWCVSSRVTEVSPTTRLATVNVAKGPVRMQFTTRNSLLPDREILMELAEGPFSRLAGEWRFDAVGEHGSRVLFRLDFEFKSRMVAAAFNAMFQSVCDSIVDAFVLRAKNIYR